MNIILSPSEGLKLTNWSLVPGKPLVGPKWNGRDTYFVYYSYGSDPEPWIFWIDIQVLFIFIYYYRLLPLNFVSMIVFINKTKI